MAAMNSTTSLGNTSAYRTGHSSVDPSELEKLAPKGPPGGMGGMGGPPGGRPGGPPGGPGGPGGHNPDLFKPRSIRFWATLVCNFLALFLVALDRTIIAPAVPKISDEFRAIDDIGWYGSAYMLTTACAQLVYGRIYKFYDMKWTFIVSVVIFEIGSTICGAAPSSVVFILGRAVAGAASAGIFSGTMLIMIPMIPLHRRPAFQGLFGLVFGLASVMGPLVGGGLTQSASWRWCFYINLPIGAVTLVFMLFFWSPPTMKRQPAPFVTHVKRLDPIGMFFFLPGTVSLLLALQWGGSKYPWDNWRIVMLFGVFVACFIAFISVQIMKPETALVPPKVITQRSVAFGVAFTFFLAGSMLLMIFYLPIWFQIVKGATPMESGINILPLVLSLVVSSIVAGMITQKIGYYVPSMLVAPAIMSIGEGLMTTFKPDTPSSQWIAYQFLAGFGLGFGMQTSGLAIQTVLPKEDISIGIAINFFMQQLGGAISTSIGQSILSNIIRQAIKTVPGFENSNVSGTGGATQLLDVVGDENRHIVVDGYNLALQRIFLAACIFAFGALVCALFMEWKSIKKGKNGQGPPGPGGPGAGGPPGQTTGLLGQGGQPGGPNSALNSPVDGAFPRHSMEPRTSNVSNQPRSAGYDMTSHTQTGVIALDPSGSHYSVVGMPAGSHYSMIMPHGHDPNGSNISLNTTAFESNNPYNQAIAAPVVFVPHSGDPNNPYGQMGMYGNSPYGQSPYGNNMMPVMYMPGFAPPPAPNADGHRDSLCGNCRCSVAGMPVPPPAASSTASLNLADEKELGGRSRSTSVSDNGRDHGR